MDMLMRDIITSEKGRKGTQPGADLR